LPTPFSFRPQLESLDVRDLPSVTPFAFALSDGTLVSGSFEYAGSAVNPSLTTQQLPITDLTVSVNGQPTALQEQLAPAVVSLSQGQLSGASFATGLANSDANMIAVANGSAVTSDATGVVATSLVSVIGGLPPVIGPNPGVGPLNWAAAVATYNANVVQLNAILTQIDQQIALFEALEPILKEARVKELFAQTPEDKLGAKLLYDAYYAKLIGHSIAISELYTQYASLYQSTLAQAAFLVQVVPLEQINLFNSLPPLISIPDRYFAPLDGLV